MSFQGRFVKVNKHSPSGTGVCDRSGFLFNHKDLKKQMEYRGNRLSWTGFLVAERYLDKPNPQFRPTRAPLDDPKPLQNARFPNDYTGHDNNPVDLKTVKRDLNNFVQNAGFPDVDTGHSNNPVDLKTIKSDLNNFVWNQRGG